jgi:hypothetical protein
MTSSTERKFKRQYKKQLQHLKLKGLQPKTIEAYSRAIRRIGEYFDHDIDELSKQQLTDYFTDLLSTHSWTAVKLDLYGLKFYYTHVLGKPWVNVDLIKPPKAQRLPDIVTVEEAGRIFKAQLSGLLLYRLQHGTSPWRRIAPTGRRYRCGAPTGAYPRRQRQQGSPGALARCDTRCAAPLLVGAP